MDEAQQAVEGGFTKRSDCHDYANNFDIYIKRERKAMHLVYTVLIVSPFIGLALIVGAGLMLDMSQNRAIMGSMVAAGTASLASQQSS